MGVGVGVGGASGGHTTGTGTEVAAGLGSGAGGVHVAQTDTVSLATSDGQLAPQDAKNQPSRSPPMVMVNSLDCARTDPPTVMKRRQLAPGSDATQKLPSLPAHVGGVG